MVFIQPKTCSISFRLRWLIAYQRQRVHGTLAFANRRIFPAGLAMVVAALACSRLPPQPFGPTDFWSTSPNQFLLRAGLVLLAVGGIAHGSGLVRAHMWTNSLARETLLVYVVHVCLVYGSPWNTGLFQMRGHTMKLAPALAYVAALWIAMTLVATTWNCVKRHHPRRGAGAAGRVEALVVSLLQRRSFLVADRLCSDDCICRSPRTIPGKVREEPLRAGVPGLPAGALANSSPRARRTRVRKGTRSYQIIPPELQC
jgi:hypothetical protein